MKPKGLHWAVQSQLIRRAGIVGTKKIKHAGVDGFSQALRTADAEFTEGGITESLEHMSGGQVFGPFALRKSTPLSCWGEMDYAASFADSPRQVSESNDATPDVRASMTVHANPAVAIIPSDISEVDLALIEDPLREVVYATDDWANTNYPIVTTQKNKQKHQEY